MLANGCSAGTGAIIIPAAETVPQNGFNNDENQGWTDEQWF